MSKKQILKNIDKKNKNTGNKDVRDNYFKFITTLAVLLLIFVISYLLIGIFFTKEIDLKKDEEKSKEEVSVDNQTIMIGQLLDQKEDEYYVLVYDFSDKLSSVPSWLSIYQENSDSLQVYKVDSSKKFNSKYIVEENSNKNAKTISELKVISPTLIKVTKNEISEYIEGEESIKDTFKNN